MQPPDALCVSIGGGPERSHPRLVNLNIGPFPNVDVVADAHRLPYADGCVDAIFCEAVLEHLHTPAQAVAEMFRVLRPRGAVLAVTPFLQAYHGYPYHYQNFTVTGHAHLFTAQGFEVTESGACVGPVHVMVTLTALFVAEYAPRWLRRPLGVLWYYLGLLLHPLDRRLNARPNAHVMASTTYVVARKPASD